MHLATLISLLPTLSVLTTSVEARRYGSVVWGRARDHSKIIDERKLPITTTKTVTVQATKTYTIWVDAVPTSSIVGMGSLSESLTASATGVTSSTETESLSASSWASDSATTVAEATVSPASSDFPSQTASSSFMDSASTQTSTFSSAVLSETETGTPSIWSTSTGGESGWASSYISSYVYQTVTASASEPTNTLGQASSTDSVVPTAASTGTSVPLGSVGIVLPSQAVSVSSSIFETSATSSVPQINATLVSSTSSSVYTSVLEPSAPVSTGSIASLSASSFYSSWASEPTAATTEITSVYSAWPTETASSSRSVPESGSENATYTASASIGSVTASSWTSQASGTVASSTAKPSTSSYVPNWKPPGAVPNYPSFSSKIVPTPTNVTSSLASYSSLASSSSSSTANSTAVVPTSVYIPNWKPPGAIPNYPSFSRASKSVVTSVPELSSTISSSVKMSSASVTSTQTQSEPIMSTMPSLTPTSTELASSTSINATAWWSSWWSASATASETASQTESESAVASTAWSSSTMSTSSPLPTLTASVDGLSISESDSAVMSPTATVSTAAETSAISSSITSASATVSSSAPLATGAGALSTATLNSRMTLGYYPDWSVWTFPVSQLDWSKLDVVDFAFAIPNADFALEFTQYNSIETLQQLVAAGHSAGKRVRLSIGGWTGSVYFSAAVSSESNRMTFANNIASVYNQYSLDGIDIDWEYPGVLGSGSNGVSSSDTANFLLFLNTLRATLPSDAFISAATQVWPFADENGSPSTDVSGFAKVLDWITVMNYDIWGSSDTPGPNAPLSDACGTSTQPLANAYAAVASWTTAGMPADQIMLGIAAYGYLQKSSANKLRTRRRHLQARDTVTIYNPNGGTDNGQVNFASLISQGALVRDDSGIWVGAGGFTREWDSCSSTPWLKSWATGQVVTYDDPQSISLKAQFARQAGLRGTSVWEITGDMGPSDWSILSAARSGLGI